MKKRNIHTKIWEDEFFSSLSPKQKLLFIYYITNDNVGLTGIYELTNKQTIFDTGLTEKEVESYKKIFMEIGRVFFLKNWVKIHNYQKYNKYSGKPLEKAIENELDAIPSLIREKFDTVSIQYQDPIDSSNIYISINTNINKEIEVKEKEKNIESISEEDLMHIAEKYEVPLSFVKSKLDDLDIWLQEKPGRGKGRNLKLTLMNWVKRDAVSIAQNLRKGVKSYDATKVLHSKDRQGRDSSDRGRIPLS